MPKPGELDQFAVEGGDELIYINHAPRWLKEQLREFPRSAEKGRPFTVCKERMFDYCATGKWKGCPALDYRRFKTRVGYAQGADGRVFARRYVKLEDLRTLVDVIKALYRAEQVPLKERRKLTFMELVAEYPRLRVVVLPG